MLRHWNDNIILGDRIITENYRLGTVVRLDRDDFGEYIVVELDLLKGQFAYDPWDLEKVKEGTE
jgi:hypothetical protein